MLGPGSQHSPRGFDIVADQCHMEFICLKPNSWTVFEITDDPDLAIVTDIVEGQLFPIQLFSGSIDNPLAKLFDKKSAITDRVFPTPWLLEIISQ